MDVRKLWKRLNQGWTGIVFSIFLGVTFATFFYYVVLASALQTNFPVVAVVSGSMDHGITDDPTKEGAYPCGKLTEDYKENFDNWWNLCGGSYSQFGINKETFMQFPFKDGFKKGDMPVVQKPKEYKEGDVVVYTAVDCNSRNSVERAPIIHRIVEIDEQGVIHTKGDHNRGQNYYENCVKEEQIHGKVIFIIPKLGYVKVFASELIGI